MSSQEMNSKNFYCKTCDKKFASWKEWKEHLLSDEHKQESRDSLVRASFLLDEMCKRMKR